MAQGNVVNKETGNFEFTNNIARMEIIGFNSNCLNEPVISNVF